LPAGLLLLAATRRLPQGAWWWRSAVLGALNIGLFFAFLFVAAYRLPGGVAAVFGALQPLVVAVLAVPLLGVLPTRRALAAGAAGVVGVSLLVLGPEAALDAWGLAAAVSGTAVMGLGVTLAKRWGPPPRPASLLALTAWQLVAGGVVLLPVALLVEGAPPAFDASAVVGYTWLIVPGTALAYALWFRGLQRLPAASVAFLGLLSPVMAVVLGWVLLGQALGPVQLLGAVVALGSVAVGQSSQAPSGPTAPVRIARRRGPARRSRATVAARRPAPASSGD